MSIAYYAVCRFLYEIRLETAYAVVYISKCDFIAKSLPPLLQTIFEVNYNTCYCDSNKKAWTHMH